MGCNLCKELPSELPDTKGTYHYKVSYKVDENGVGNWQNVDKVLAHFINKLNCADIAEDLVTEERCARFIPEPEDCGDFQLRSLGKTASETQQVRISTNNNPEGHAQNIMNFHSATFWDSKHNEIVPTGCVSTLDDRNDRWDCDTMGGEYHSGAGYGEGVEHSVTYELPIDRSVAMIIIIARADGDIMERRKRMVGRKIELLMDDEVVWETTFQEFDGSSNTWTFYPSITEGFQLFKGINFWWILIILCVLFLIAVGFILYPEARRYKF